MQKHPARLSALIYLCLGLVMTIPVCAQDISVARQDELMNLLKQDCGSCHGLTMQGGLGPALTAQALSDKPKDAMVATILNGRPGTPMPPWANQLTEAETRWLVENLYQGLK
jgi:cytochrome c55X